MIRWRMMKIHLSKIHHPIAEVAQEHHLGGSGAGGPVSSDDEEMKDNDAKGNDEDPKELGGWSDWEELYPKDCEMLVSFCHLPKSSANTIVVYFGMSMINK